MIKLMIAGPGQGKTHWLHAQRAQILVACTNKSHRSILATVADHLNIAYPSRASIDDLISLILAHPPTSLGFDDIDRAPAKFIYSLLTLSSRHEIFATATEKRRIKPLLDRQAAIIVPVPPAPIAEIVASRYPDLSPATIRRIASIAANPAAALNIAENIKKGEPLPTPPTTSIAPVIIIIILSAIIFFRFYAGLELHPLLLAALSGIAFLIRRIGWRIIE